MSDKSVLQSLGSRDDRGRKRFSPNFSHCIHTTAQTDKSIRTPISINLLYIHLAHANYVTDDGIFAGVAEAPTHTPQFNTHPNQPFPRTSPIQNLKRFTILRHEFRNFPIWPSLFCVGRGTYFGKDFKCTSRG